MRIPSPPRPAGSSPDDIIPAPDNRAPPLPKGPASCCIRLPPPVRGAPPTRLEPTPPNRSRPLIWGLHPQLANSHPQRTEPAQPCRTLFLLGLNSATHNLRPSCTGSCRSGPRRTARAASLRTSQTYNSSPSSQSPSRTYGSSPSSQSPARTYDSSPSSRAPPGPTTPPPVLRAPPLPRRSCSVLQNPASVVVFVTQSPDTTGPNSCHSNFLHVVAKSRHRTRIIVSAPLPLSLHQNNLLILTPGILEILRHSSPAPQSEDQTTLTVVTSDPDAASGYSRCFNILYKLVCPSISFILAC